MKKLSPADITLLEGLSHRALKMRKFVNHTVVMLEDLCPVKGKPLLGLLRTMTATDDMDVLSKRILVTMDKLKEIQGRGDSAEALELLRNELADLYSGLISFQEVIRRGVEAGIIAPLDTSEIGELNETVPEGTTTH